MGWLTDLIEWLSDKYKMFIEMVEEYKKQMKKREWERRIA